MSQEDIERHCAHCGGNMLEARLQGPGYDREVYIQVWKRDLEGHPDSFLLKAWMCMACGKTELQADVSGAQKA